MNQIKSIQLGVIAICMATVSLSLAQTPRIRTSGSNQIGAINTTAAPRNSGLSGNPTRSTQTGINAGSATITGATANAGPRQTLVCRRGSAIKPVGSAAALRELVA